MILVIIHASAHSRAFYDTIYVIYDLLAGLTNCQTYETISANLNLIKCFYIMWCACVPNTPTPENIQFSM